MSVRETSLDAYCSIEAKLNAKQLNQETKMDMRTDSEIEKAEDQSGGKEKGKKKRGAGRQDNTGQEAVVDVSALKKGMPKAIKLEKELADARTDASNFYKQFAKEAGLNAAQLKAAARAYANEEIEATRRKAEQMSLIIEECGES